MDNHTKPLVLYVEDEPLVRLAVEETLSESGFDFVVVVTGEYALDELEKDAARFCALLTDVRMPGRATSWDVAKRAREICPTIPVIYMTGGNAHEWAANGVPNSILLHKPFADAQIVAALANLLNQSPLAG